MMMGGLRSVGMTSFKDNASTLHNVNEIVQMRHESQFQPLGRANHLADFMQGPKVGGDKVVETSNFVDSSEYQKKDDLGKLDELIGNFTLPE